MKTERSLAIMKALADQSRLAIVKSLLEHSQYAEELAKRHGLAPSTVSFHLRKLEQAGLVTTRKEQYYVMVRANDSVFNTTLWELVSAAPVTKELQDRRMDDYRRKVLEAFFRHGRLEKLPAQHKKRLIVLEQFAARFEAERRYSEQEATGLILPLFDDYCTVRRLLVDEGLIRREGTIYWRETEADGAIKPAALPEASGKGEKAMSEKSKRAEIKRTCKQNAPDIGVFQIRNRVNGKIYIAASRNLEGERNSRMFQLKMGKVVFNRELQQDLTCYGADQFEFSVLAVLDRLEPGADIERALAELELQWLHQLQPFGDRGYNNAKAYERGLERLQLKSEGTIAS